MPLTAAVPKITRAAPASSHRVTASRLRTPPPTSTGIRTAAMSRWITATLTGAPENAPSRSITCSHAAPAVCQRRAASTGSPS